MKRAACVLFALILSAGSTCSTLSIAEEKTHFSATTHPDTGSDGWGYMWTRSDEPGGPTFRWVDITARGTLVTGLGDDNYVGPFQMQFAFPYYWYTVGSFYIGSNGYFCCYAPTSFASPFGPLPTTSPVVPKDLFAILVGDLDFTVTGANARCYYWTNGSDSLVVSFINVTEWQQVSNPNLKHTFQVILNKRDSSFTYQYGLQQGRFADSYLCIGWQNQTGQFGCTYTYSSPLHPLMPDSGLAIKIKRVREVPWVLPDAGVMGGFDSENLAKIIRTGIADTIECVVKNFGNTSLTNVQVRYAITKIGQPSAYDTVIVPSMTLNQQATVTFPRPFTPNVAGTYSALFNVTIPNDVSPSNNSKTAEILSASFGAGQSTLIRYESGIESGYVWLPVEAGYGISIDLPPETLPVRVETVYVRIGNIMAQPLTVKILGDSSGTPGTILATRVVSATANAMNAIDFTADNVVISGGRFFVAGLGYMQFLFETYPPISYRPWEYINGWIPHRSRDIQDMIIRASVRGVTTNVKQVSYVIPDGFALEQNYPNPFNPSTKIQFSIPKQDPVTLSIYDVTGSSVRILINQERYAPGVYSITWDGTNQSGRPAATGVYFARMQSGSYSSAVKLLLVK